MPTFTADAITPRLVAATALSQLNRRVVFPNAALMNYEPDAFERGETVTVRRAKLVAAQDYDPRSGIAAQSIEPGYASANLVLEKLFTAGFPVYAHDNRVSRTRYVLEYGQQIATSIAVATDTYFYNKFRTLTLPSVGPVYYTANPPVAIVATENSQGVLAEFNKTSLINANTALEFNNVSINDRFAIISTAAKGAFLGDSILTEKFGDATGEKLFIRGLPAGQFSERYGFQVSGSNSVGSQSGQSGLDGAAAPAIDFTTATPNNFFYAGDIAVPTLLGAVDFQMAPAAIANIAVGMIARIGVMGAPSKAYGLILRVDMANRIITLVPCAPNGRIQPAAAFVPGTDKLSIPLIPSVNVALQREALLGATRLLTPPSDGSGAISAIVADEFTGMVVQVIRGNYKVDEFKESQRYAALMGALLSDYRKAALILTQ